MKVRHAVFVCLLLQGCGGEPAAPVRLEFRAAEPGRVEGWEEYRSTGGELFFIGDSVLLDASHVAHATVVMRDGWAEIELLMTEEGRRRFARATELRQGKHIGMLVDGRLISAPLVRAPITAGRAILQGGFQEDEARRIARGLNRQEASR